MKDFLLESDCPIQPSLDFAIHPVASGPTLSLSSRILWSPGPRLWWSVYIIHHIFILGYTRFNSAKDFSALIICIDAIPCDKTWISSSWAEVTCFSFASKNQRSLLSIIGRCILRELLNMGQWSCRPRGYAALGGQGQWKTWDLNNPNAMISVCWASP